MGQSSRVKKVSKVGVEFLEKSAQEIKEWGNNLVDRLTETFKTAE